MQTIEQDISWYKVKYLDKKDWLTKKSQHYVFHYFKGSLAEKDINKIVKIQEQSHRKILRILELKNKKTIKYYFYPSRKIKEKLMGDDGYGNAIWLEISKKKEVSESKRFEIHVIYNNKCKLIGEHEDTHLLSLPWGVAIFLFCEGLAEFISEKWHDRDTDSWAREYLEKDKLYSVDFLISNKNWDKVDDMIAYPQAGSFVRYLVNTYEMEKFRVVYKKLSRNKKVQENIDIIEKSYSKSIKGLEEDWRECLKNG